MDLNNQEVDVWHGLNEIVYFSKHLQSIKEGTP